MATGEHNAQLSNQTKTGGNIGNDDSTVSHVEGKELKEQKTLKLETWPSDDEGGAYSEMATSDGGHEVETVPVMTRQKSDHDALVMRGRSAQKTFVLIRVGRYVEYNLSQQDRKSDSAF
jgi:hypothetical protein